MSKKSAAVRVAVLSTVLAPALGLGLVHEAEAGIIHKNGCTVEPYAPTPIYKKPYKYPVAAEYRVRVTCDPYAWIHLKQRAWEDDSTPTDHRDDLVSKRSGGYAFNHPSGWKTKVFRWTSSVPNTERGAEEIYHSIKFRVDHGSNHGSWSGWTSSPTVSFPG